MLRNLSIVTAILVILGTGLYLVKGNNSSTANKQTRSGEKLISTAQIKDLDRITIQNSAKVMELKQNTDSSWTVVDLNYEADAAKIHAMIVSLLETKVGDLITKEEDKKEMFQVATAPSGEATWDPNKHGKLLTLSDKAGKMLAQIRFGKDRSNGEGQYFRFENETQIYLLAKSLRIETKADEWLNKTIVDWDGKEVVGKINYKRADQAEIVFERAKEDKEWKVNGLKDKEKVASTEVFSFASGIKDLMFSAIIAADKAPAETGREKVAEVTLENFDGRSLKITIGEKEVGEKKNYYATFTQSLKESVTDESLKQQVESFNKRSKPWFFLLDSWVGKRFLKEANTLITTS